jgi:hypothetical protein
MAAVPNNSLSLWERAGVRVVRLSTAVGEGDPLAT